MFYCPACATEKGWPESMARSEGRCEVCGKTRVCYDVPSKYLPLPAEPPITQEELETALSEELGRIQDSGDGWIITHAELDGRPVPVKTSREQEPPLPPGREKP
jgi:hypothetical protein